MTQRKEELILAALTTGLPYNVTTFGGYFPTNGLTVGDPVETLNEAGLFLGPRYLLEDMPEFMQIIPYIIVRKGNKFVSYTRTPKGGEARLQGKTSVGLGGHIDLADARLNPCTNQVDLQRTVEYALQRELEEEVPGINVDNVQFVGLLTDVSDAVGKVHIGLVVACDLVGDLPVDNEDALASVKLRTADELLGDEFTLEKWSRLVLEFARQRGRVATTP